MCGCLTPRTRSALLKPPGGRPPLELKRGVTWIGRGDFDVSLRAQLLCSRRQACFEFTDTGLRLECHGCNPVLFVVCHSKNFFGTEATPATELFQLRKGEAVQLANGDQFYFAALECLLTVDINQHDNVHTLSDSMHLPLLQAGETCVKDKEKDLIGYHVADEQEMSENLRQRKGLPQDCGTSSPEKLSLKDGSDMCAIPPRAVSSLHGRGVARSQELLAAPKPTGNPKVNCRPFEKSKEGILRNDEDDSDSLALDVFDCTLLGGDTSFDLRQSPLRISPQGREEAAELEERSFPSEYPRASSENRTEEVSISNTVKAVNEIVEDVKLSIDGDGVSRPSYDIRQDCAFSQTYSLSKDITHVSDDNGDSPREASAPREITGQIHTKDCNLIMSNETINVRSHEDELLRPEQSGGSTPVTIADCSTRLVNLNSGEGDSRSLSGFPFVENRNEVPVRMDVEEHLETADRVNAEEGEPAVTADAEDELWTDGPVEGMDQVIASLSGYEGLDRQNLVKLINKTGAAYTGVFSKANTHLVCWNFYGKKFDRAMKLHKVVINHQWFEDCLRAGRRLPEDPYKLRSGEDVGPLKWKATLTPAMTKRDEQHSGAADRLHDNATVFSDTIDLELNTRHGGEQVICSTSYERNSPGIEQAGPSNVETAPTGSRKSRRLIKRSGLEVRVSPLNTKQDNMSREESSAPECSGRPGGSHRRGYGECSDALEQGYRTRRRKSANAILCHETGQEQGHDSRRRKSESSVLHRRDGGQNREAFSSLRGKPRGSNKDQPSSGSQREVTVINLADDDEDMREITLPSSHAASLQTTEGINADYEGKSSQNSQSSQRDREVACAICLVEAKSSCKGLLQCGHVFCYKCIFTWTVQAVKGPNCPLCKAPCDFITKQELSSLGEIEETVVVVGNREKGLSTRTSRTVVLDAVCIHCGSGDSESLLRRCATCGDRAIHEFCLDPPGPPPWLCPGCAHGHHRDSMRLAWNQFLSGPSTAYNPDSTQEFRPTTRSLNTRRRNIQPYSLRRPSRPVSAYRPTLHAEIAQSMGPVRRRSVVGQHSLRSWLGNDINGGP